MKKNIFLFNEESRAAAYGIGTYINQMIYCLTNIDNVFLHIIQLKAKTKHFTIVTQKGYDEFIIPYSALSVDNPERYYRNAWYLFLLNSNIENNSEIFFLLNFNSQYCLIDKMRIAFPNCNIYMAIHYQEWCFKLNGKISTLNEIISKDKKELNLDEFQIYDSFFKEKSMYHKVDKIICLSRFTENTLWDYYKVSRNRTILIYNGLKDKFDKHTQICKNKLKEQLGFLPNDKVILYVGRLDPIKGVKLLIRSFHMIVKDHPNCHLVLIGDGDFSSYMKENKQYWNKIIFTGRLREEDLFQFYRIANVGVLPSLHEQCSYTAIEMMMFDIPLIASTTTGLKEMICENRNGFLFDMQSEDDIVGINNLAELLRKTLFTKIEKLNPRFDYLERYTIEKMELQYKYLINLDR